MTDVSNYEALLKDENKLKEIGSEITRRAMVAALEQKMGLPPSYAPGMRTIKVGDPVPSDLVAKITLRPDGTAAKGWSDSGWTDIGIWERSTWDKTGDTSKFGIKDINTLPPLDRMKLLNKLSQDEIQILKAERFID